MPNRTSLYVSAEKGRVTQRTIQRGVLVTTNMSSDSIFDIDLRSAAEDANGQPKNTDEQAKTQGSDKDTSDNNGTTAAGTKRTKTWVWLLSTIVIVTLVVLAFVFVIQPLIRQSLGGGTSTTSTSTNAADDAAAENGTTAGSLMSAQQFRGGPNNYDGADHQVKWQRIDGARRLTPSNKGKPFVVELNSLLKLTECQEIIDMCEKHNLFTPSRVVNFFTRSRASQSKAATGMVSTFRTSHSAHLARAQTPLVAEIEKRAAKIMGCPVSHLEPLQVVRYTPGQQFRPHHDYFAPGSPAHARAMATSGQRQSTILIYLNDMEPGETGGRTVFPKLDIGIQPRAGRAVWWHNCKPNGQEEPLTLHGGEPPVKSTKYAINVWSRARPYLSH